jgi:hypothetical protein
VRSAGKFAVRQEAKSANVVEWSAATVRRRVKVFIEAAWNLELARAVCERNAVGCKWIFYKSSYESAF